MKKSNRKKSTVDERYRKLGKIPKMGKSFPNKIKRFKDFRKMLEQKNIDDVFNLDDNFYRQSRSILQPSEHYEVMSGIIRTDFSLFDFKKVITWD